MKKHDLNHRYQYHIYEIISYMSTKPRIEAKNDFKKDFLSQRIMEFLENL